MDDVELPELPESAREERKDRLNALVAITVTLVVAFMAICKIADNNIVLKMQQAQAAKVDKWAWYQALNVREDINQDKLAELRDEADEEQTPQQKKAAGMKIAGYEAAAGKIKDKKDKVKNEAEEEEKTYDRLDERHEKFDITEGAVSIAVSMLAITSLLQKRWMYVAALVPAAVGVFFGIWGLLG